MKLIAIGTGSFSQNKNFACMQSCSALMNLCPWKVEENHHVLSNPEVSSNIDACLCNPRVILRFVK